MSSSDRNVGPNVGSTASYHVPLQEFFGDLDPRRRRNNAAQAEEVQEEELPNERITWTICLNQINITHVALCQLSTELRNSHNMDLFPSNTNRDIVTISGIPPDNDFGEHTLIEVVRTYAPNAKVVQE